jgi:hypothetical protein
MIRSRAAAAGNVSPGAPDRVRAASSQSHHDVRTQPGCQLHRPRESRRALPARSARRKLAAGIFNYTVGSSASSHCLRLRLRRSAGGAVAYLTCGRS